MPENGKVIRHDPVAFAILVTVAQTHLINVIGLLNTASQAVWRHNLSIPGFIFGLKRRIMNRLLAENFKSGHVMYFFEWETIGRAAYSRAFMHLTNFSLSQVTPPISQAWNPALNVISLRRLLRPIQPGTQNLNKCGLSHWHFLLLLLHLVLFLCIFCHAFSVMGLNTQHNLVRLLRSPLSKEV